MYNLMAISITSKCNAACKMCCFDCSPTENTYLTDEQILKLIEEANDIETINGIGFSGGEPLLRKKILLEAICYAKSFNLRVSCISNGFWGKNYKYALKTAKEMKLAGLSELSLSYDDFHKEYIEFDSIKNVIRACGEVGIKCNLGIGITKSSNMAGYFIDRLGESGFNASFEYYPILPVGQAAINIPEEDFIKTFSKYGNRCVNSGIVTVLFDGNIYPCCSQIVKDTALALGNINDNNFSDVYKNINGNIALFILWKYGFDWYVKIIEDNKLKKLSENYVSPCQLCHEIFSDYDLITKLTPFMKEEVKNYVGTRR